MYIGDTDDGSGLHHMVYEVVDNGIDEALAGHADFVVTSRSTPTAASRSATTARGIPSTCTRPKGVSAAEVIMTQLHAGGKFDSNSYKVSGGLHGVGVSVVNAHLSDWLELRVWRNGKEHYARFENGDTVEHLRVVAEARAKRAPRCTFLPRQRGSARRHLLEPGICLQGAGNRLRELAFLNSGVRIILRTNATPEPTRGPSLIYEGGVREFVKYHRPLETPVMPEPIFIQGEKNGIGVEVAMWWNDSYHETVLPFTNNIPQRDGGTHLAGFRGALTRVINNYAQSSGRRGKERST